MGCQSRYVGEMIYKKPMRSYIDAFVLNTGFKLQADLLFGTSLKLKHCLKAFFSGNGASRKSEPFKSQPLQEGDLVKVRPIHEIVQTLNFRQKLGGCFFLEDMENFCDREFLVEKKVGYFFDELAYKIYKTSDVVLLQGVGCTGNLPLVKYTCNRSCLYFWKEAWLEKIASPKSPALGFLSPAPSTSQQKTTKERVRVRSKKEIQATLNPENKLDGCLFMEEMWGYCGREFVVEQKVDYLFNENNYTMAQARDVVILKDVRCSGTVAAFHHKCDRYCSLLWKTAWLDKIAY